MQRPSIAGCLFLMVVITWASLSWCDVGWSQTTNETTLEETLSAILQAQAKAWNEGSIEGFMDHYWKSEQLSFCSGGKRNFGWQAVYEGYQERYPTPEKMGQLAFSNLEVRALGDDAALVLGDWQLIRPADRPGGNFSLIFQRIDGDWVITHDHTSSREAEKVGEVLD